MRRLIAVSLLVSLTACSRPVEIDPLPTVDVSSSSDPGRLSAPLAAAPAVTPSPDPTRAVTVASEPYIVRAGDTVGGIALEYNTTPDAIAQASGLADAASISIGQILSVPLDGITQTGPESKIMPDSEAAYGPSAIGFNVADFVSRTNGYLRSYTEEVEGETLTGAQIVQLIAEQYSVGPRTLLALIEYRGGWLSDPAPDSLALFYPAGHASESWSGLHKQLMWAADHINEGYYGWKTRGKQTLLLSDFTRVRIAPGLNPGTIGLQSMLAVDALPDQWRIDVGPDGLLKTYRDWFGDPFAMAVEPLVPSLLYQPPWPPPWPQAETWYFTGGPHGGWASGSAWSALDFIPPDDGLGCYGSEEWITSMADGLVIRSRGGEVLVDFDGDGSEQTGWVIFYMHVGERDRVLAGTPVKVGDRIGHPSCEGGFSTATHVHVARRYNGEWIAADGAYPFSIGGWTPLRGDQEYGGVLEKDGVRKEACECRDDVVNGIAH